MKTHRSYLTANEKETRKQVATLFPNTLHYHTLSCAVQRLCKMGKKGGSCVVLTEVVFQITLTLLLHESASNALQILCIFLNVTWTVV